MGNLEKSLRDNILADVDEDVGKINRMPNPASPYINITGKYDGTENISSSR
jgi:hypothetical protein